MSERVKVCAICPEFEPDGPTDLGIGGWCGKYHDAVLLVSVCERRDVIEAILSGAEVRDIPGFMAHWTVIKPSKPKSEEGCDEHEN